MNNFNDWRREQSPMDDHTAYAAEAAWNHQQSSIKELEEANAHRKELNAQMLMNATESGNRNYLSEIESLLSTIKELEDTRPCRECAYGRIPNKQHATKEDT